MDRGNYSPIISVDLRQEYQAWLDWLTPVLVNSEGFDETSSTYQRELAKIWSKWDTLESARKQQDVGLGSLHEDIARLRRNYRDIQLFKSLLEREGSTERLPLWTCVERFKSSQSTSHSSDASTQSAEAYWGCFQELVKNQNGFWGLLSKVQQITWQILHDWWNAAYQDEVLAIAARESIHGLAYASSDLPVDPSSDAIESARAKDSNYHFSGFYLFWQEFNRSSWVPEASDTWLPLLQEARICFATQARSQKIAYSFYAKNRKKAELHRLPYFEDPSTHCPWLPEADISHGKPYYLWDVGSERTVLVNELCHSPDYICISHTWGRWRRPPSMDVIVKGVPWKVPSNSKFDVQNLPHQLKNLNLPYSYVWFDLLCIPQDESEEDLRQLANVEISRQSSIFRCSSMCFAWFNEISDWSALLRALEWMSALFLHKSADRGVYETNEMLAETFEVAGVPIELMLTRLSSETISAIKDKTSGQQIPEFEYEASIWPSPWFSSLGTLQEAVLCPSLIIMNRKWEPLTDGAGSVIPLNALLSFTNLCNVLEARPPSYELDFSSPFYFDYGIQDLPGSEMNAWEKWPLGAQQTLKLCVLTRMHRLVETPSVPFVFALANLRQCTGSRAPAIMSALGITDWYPDPDSPLVLGMYPLSFVREAAAKLGASFYGIHNHRVWMCDPFGSLLPFTKPQGWLTGAMDVREVPPLQREDHPAVKSWMVNADASVTMRRAFWQRVAGAIHGISMFRLGLS